MPEKPLDTPTLERVETAENLAFQRREWLVERLGWCAMAAAVIAATAGLFGDGPLSRARVANADGSASVDYNRFVRLQSPDRARVVLARANTEVRLGLARRYVTEDVAVEHVTPEPLRAELGAEDVIYVFRALEADAVVTFDLRARRPGRLDGYVRVGDDAPIRFTQYVYP